MNASQPTPDDELNPRSFWQRAWPILVGVLIALALAAVGYWAGTRGSGGGTAPAASDAAASIPASGTFSSASDAAASEAATGVTFQGPFTAEAALQAIFGESTRKGSETFGRWSQPRLPADLVFQPFQGRGPLRVSPLGIHPVQAGNEARQLLLFQSVPEDPNYGADGDGAIIGAAIFRPAAGGWELVQETRAVTAAGAFGQAPQGRPLALGQRQWGVLLEGTERSDGIQRKYALLIEQTEQRFVDTGVRLDLGADNKANCAETVPDAPPCFAYTGQLRVNPNAGGERFQIELTTKGTRLNGANELESFVETRVYKYQAGRYAEDPARHTLKVKPLAPVLPADAAASAPAGDAPAVASPAF